MNFSCPNVIKYCFIPQSKSSTSHITFWQPLTKKTVAAAVVLWWPIKTWEWKYTVPIDCVSNNGPLNDIPQIPKTGYLIIVLVMAKSKQSGKKYLQKKTFPMNIKKNKYRSAWNPDIFRLLDCLATNVVKFPCLCMTAVAFRPIPVTMGSLSHNI